MFDGRDYHRSFEEALDKLTGRILDRDEVLGELVALEWTLWEAIRGAMIIAGNLAALLVLVPLWYFFVKDGGWVVGAIFVGAWLIITVGLYWLFKFAVYYEVGRHVRGRRFGGLDLPWLRNRIGQSVSSPD